VVIWKDRVNEGKTEREEREKGQRLYGRRGRKMDGKVVP